MQLLYPPELPAHHLGSDGGLFLSRGAPRRFAFPGEHPAAPSGVPGSPGAGGFHDTKIMLALQPPAFAVGSCATSPAPKHEGRGKKVK
jgi:hypothetical protein